MRQLETKKANLDMSLPNDDIVNLEVAFDMLGKHRFGSKWENNMAVRVRLGQRRTGSEEEEMAYWAPKALMICVQNGWLPLYYFEGESFITRVEFFTNPRSLTISGLFPRPTDNPEHGGMIQLSDGELLPCMVNVRKFDAILRTKFSNQKNRKNPESNFADFDDSLDEFFRKNPISTPRKDVIYYLKMEFKGQWPKRTAMYEHINEAAQRATDRIRTSQAPDGQADGQG